MGAACASKEFQGQQAGEVILKGGQLVGVEGNGHRAGAGALDSCGPWGTLPVPVLEGRSTPMMRNQDALPKMKVQDLRDTCELYLKCVSPLLSEGELARTEEQVAEFVGAEGAALHKKLLEYDGDKVCYMEDFYRNTYLDATYSNLSSNPSFVLEKQHDSQIAAATDLIMSSLHYHHTICQGTMEPWGKKTAPLCMQQLLLLFASARIVSKDRDETKSFLASSRHIVVSVNGDLYSLQVLGPKGEILVDKRLLGEMLARITGDGARNAVAPGEAVGALTAASRADWAAARARLEIADPLNKAMLEAVDSALFVVCLDKHRGLTAEQMIRNVIYGLPGSAHNRWLDKWCWIVCEDGQAGFNWEHSMLDGHTMQEAAATIAALPGCSSDAVVAPDAAAAKVARLRFVLDDFTRSEISDVTEETIKTGDGFAYAPLEYGMYGTAAIKKFGCSPDGFLQAAVAIAWFRRYGTLGVPYESVLAKAFKHGRVFVARNMNQQIADAIRAYCSQNASDEVKRAAVCRISQEVVEICKAASGGHDIDRPFLALRNVAKQECSTVSLCEGPAWSKLQSLNFVTSHCGRAPIRFFCFEGGADFFGIGYFAKADGVQFSVTHANGAELARFTKELSVTLDELHAAFAASEQEKREQLGELSPTRPRLAAAAAAALAGVPK